MNTQENKKVRQKLHSGVLELAQRGLNLLELALKQEDPKGENDKIGFELFDIMTLRGLLKGEVYAEFSKKEKETFVSKHGVDFPEYIGEELQPKEFTLTREQLERRLVLLEQNTNFIVKELIKRGFNTVEHETLGTIINGDSEGELGSAITDLYILADTNSSYAEDNFRTDKEHNSSKAAKKLNIQIEKIASIEVERDDLDVFKEHSAMDEEQAVFIMIENVEGLHEDGLDDDPELKTLVGKILDELEEDIEYIHFYSM